MKFGGFTSAGEGKAVMRILKDQPLFDSMGELTEFKSETIVKFGNTRQVGGRCFLDLYTYAISKEKIGDEKWEAVNKEMNGILAEKLDIKVPEIKVDDVSDVEMSANDTFNLGWLIKE